MQMEWCLGCHRDPEPNLRPRALAVIAMMAHRGRFGVHYYNPVEGAGLYWHFVDIVWIFLFPLLYLVGRHG